MGRTVTPFSIVLMQEESRLKKFRRALRAKDQRRFDELFEHVRRNIQAAVQAAAREPMESVVLLMLIGMQKKIEELKALVSEVETEEPFGVPSGGRRAFEKKVCISRRILPINRELW